METPSASYAREEKLQIATLELGALSNEQLEAALTFIEALKRGSPVP